MLPKHRILLGIVVLAFVVQINTLPTAEVPPLFAWMLSISHHLQFGLLFAGSGLVAWGFSQSASQQVSTSAISHQPDNDAIQNTTLVETTHISPNAEISNQPSIESEKPNTQKNNAFAFLPFNLHLLTFNSLLFWILLLALIVRLWDLELAITRFLDEILYMDAVVRLWNAPQRILIPFSNVTSFTWLFPYLQSFTAWGLNPGLTSVRIVSVVFGVAQVAAVHFLGKHLFNRKIALAAALVLATFPVHVHFSRIGINNIADPVFGTLALGFLVKGLRTQHRLDFVLAGYCLGFTHYFYEGGRLFFTPFVGLWLGWVWLFGRRQSDFTLPARGNLLALLGTLLALMIPVLHVYSVHSDTLTPRLAEMFDNAQEYQLRAADKPLLERLQNTLTKLPMPLQALVSEPETGWFYGGNYPVILPPVLPFFVVGVLVCLLRLRTLGASLVIWWGIGTGVGISFMSGPLEIPRYLVLLPAVALIMGVGIATILDVSQWLFAKITRHAKAITYFFIIFWAVYITSIQAGYYALVHVPNYYERLFVRGDGGHRLPDTDDALLRAAFLPPNTTAIIVTPRPIYPINMETVPAFWRRKDLFIQHASLESLDELLAQLPFYRNYAFFLEQGDGASLEIIQKYFALTDDPALFGSLSPYRVPQDMQMVLYFTLNGVPPQFAPPASRLPAADEVDLTDVAE